MQKKGRIIAFFALFQIHMTEYAPSPSSIPSTFDLTLDLSGLNCPLPILRTKKALATLPAHAIIEVFATDPAAPEDFAAFCRQTGHQLLQSDTQTDGRFRLIVQRKATT